MGHFQMVHVNISVQNAFTVAKLIFPALGCIPCVNQILAAFLNGKKYNKYIILNSSRTVSVQRVRFETDRLHTAYTVYHIVYLQAVNHIIGRRTENRTDKKVKTTDTTDICYFYSKI